ncbi:hypothetical protein [Sphingobacterium faecium]|uniref:hypothetical protein n=1 Tax=Sphingobacterium faecium TaxID=34087 RepID=UPI00320B06C4
MANINPFIFVLLKQYSIYTMIVTSTHTIEGREVLRYFDPISATAVIGSNALSAIWSQFDFLIRVLYFLL